MYALTDAVGRKRLYPSKSIKVHHNNNCIFRSLIVKHLINSYTYQMVCINFKTAITLHNNYIYLWYHVDYALVNIFL
jgi:hypothetical protein